MSANDSYSFPSVEGTPDWIELLNTSDSIICLKGWCLSDDLDEPVKWCFPDTCLLPEEYLVVLASGEENPSSGLQANFRLQSSGEELYLLNDSGLPLDELQIPRLDEDISFGKALDNNADAVLSSPTPGKGNSAALFYGDRLIRFSPDTFFYRQELLLNVTTSDSCHRIVINQDGRPDHGDVYDVRDFEIEVDFDPAVKPYFSLQPTITDFKPPVKVSKHPTITAHCIDTIGRVISSRSQTYVDLDKVEEETSLPVVFMQVEEGDFFSSRHGIMVPGEDFNYENEGRDWERPTKIHVYQSDDGLQYFSRAGVRIHGHATRSLPQKSMKLYFRQEYDSRQFPGHLLDRDFDLDRVLLRSFHSEFVGNEFNDFGFRDDVVMRIIGSDDLVYAQNSRPCLVYVNGEYWGIYSLHEATDDDFIGGLEDLPVEEVRQLSGPASAYDAFSPVMNLDLDDPVDRMAFERHFDLDNLTDYFIFQTFFFNTDWPFNNVKLWRDTSGIEPFKFILFDLDASFRFPRTNPFARLVPGAGLSDRYPDQFFKLYGLLLSSEYFIERMSARYFDLRRDILDPSQMLPKARAWRDAIEPHIEAHSSRWHYPKNKEVWEKSFSEIEHFIISRMLYFDDFMRDLSPPLLYPNPNYSGEVYLSGAERFDHAKIFSLDGRLLGELSVTNRILDVRPWAHLKYLVIRLSGPNGSRSELLFLP